VNELRSSRLLIDGRGENLNAYGGKVRWHKGQAWTYA
jgi:hypothetical protein